MNRTQFFVSLAAVLSVFLYTLMVLTILGLIWLPSEVVFINTRYLEYLTYGLALVIGALVTPFACWTIKNRKRIRRISLKKRLSLACLTAGPYFLSAVCFATIVYTPSETGYAILAFLPLVSTFSVSIGVFEYMKAFNAVAPK